MSDKADLNEIAKITGEKAISYVGMARQGSLQLARTRYLSDATEFAIRSVTVAWDRPISDSTKLWAAFHEHLAHRLHTDTVTWAMTVHRREEDRLDGLLPDAERHITAIVQLGLGEAPEGWLINESPVGWAGLTEDERELLVEAVTAAHYWLEDVTVWLFGSRAVGRARGDSDYDLLIVVPDHVQVGLQGQVRGAVSTVFRRRGVLVDHYLTTMSGLIHPDVGSALLYEKVQKLGFPIPWPANADPGQPIEEG